MSASDTVGPTRTLQEEVYCFTVNFNHLTLSINYNKAKKKSRWLRYAIVVAMLVIALYNVVLMLPDRAVPEGIRFELRGGPTSPLLDHPRLFLVENILVSVIYLCGLYALVKLMRRFEQGEFFSVRTVRHLRTFAFSLLLASVASVVLPPLILLAARLLGVDHVTSVGVGVDSGDIWQGLISAVFFIVAIILGEATQLAEDNQWIV